MSRRRYHPTVRFAQVAGSRVVGVASSPRPAPRRRLLALALLVATLGCSSVQLVPEAYGLGTVAIASLHARREIGVQSTELSPVFLEGELGDEVIEMTIADTEALVADIFTGATIVPAGKVMQSKKYDLVPEALPPEEWSQVNRMLAVDVDASDTPAALGVLARDLRVDAVLVVRHEWWLQRDRVDLGTSNWGYDRCTLLLVDDEDAVVWRQTVVTRAPSRALMTGAFQVGFNGATWADEARSLARETSRMAWAELRARYAAGPPDSARKPKQTPPPPPSPPPGVTP